jgi:hypothetical protein
VSYFGKMKMEQMASLHKKTRWVAQLYCNIFFTIYCITNTNLEKHEWWQVIKFIMKDSKTPRMIQDYM